MEYTLRNLIQAWSMNRIPGQGGGIPNILALDNNQVSRVPLSDIPSTWQMVTLHEQNGSRLCRNMVMILYKATHNFRERDHAARLPNMEVNNALLFKLRIVFNIIYISPMFFSAFRVMGEFFSGNCQCIYIFSYIFVRIFHQLVMEFNFSNCVHILMAQCMLRDSLVSRLHKRSRVILMNLL